MNILRNLSIVRGLKTSTNLQALAASRCQENIPSNRHKFLLSKPILDENYLLDVKNIERINENIQQRKGVGDIYLVHDISNKLQDESLNPESRKELETQLQEEMRKIPNDTHPEVRNYGEEPKAVKFYNEEPSFKHKPLEFSEICKKLNILRTDHLGNFSGHKTYYLMNDLAELVCYTAVSYSKLIYFHTRNKL